MKKDRPALWTLSGLLAVALGCASAPSVRAQPVPDIRAQCIESGYRPGSLRYDRCIETLAYRLSVPVEYCPTAPNPFRAPRDQLYPQCYGTAAAPYLAPR